MMKALTAMLLGSTLLFGGVACTNVARTNSEATDNPGQVGEVPTTTEAQDSEGDATSDLRKRQLEADIRAREERNEVVNGGDTKRTDGDLQSEVRSKLEANLPAGQLTVEAEDGVVTVSGTVPTQPQLDRIDPLAREIKGVRDVAVNVVVEPAQPQQN